MDILTFLGLDYRVASLITLYFDTGNDYRVVTLSKLYLTSKGITMQSLKSIRQF